MITIPHVAYPITRSTDGSANEEMQGWMRAVTDALNFLEVAEGSGSPEGVLFAPMHKQYFNTSGSPGSFYYRKTTDDSVNTGWVAIG